MLEHAREVEAHDLAAGLGDVVVGASRRASCRRRGGGRRRLAAARRPLGPATGRSGASGSSPVAPSTAASAASSLLVIARCRRRLGIERGAERLELVLVALLQLGLELDEAVDDAAAAHDIDLVEAELDAAPGRLEQALATQLANGHELDERRVAGMLEHQRSGVRRRPVDRRRRRGRPGPSSSSRRTEPPGPSVRGERLDRDDRLAAGLAEPHREAGPAEGAVGGVDVAVLELRATGRDRRVTANGPTRSAASSRSAAASSPTRYLSSTSTGRVSSAVTRAGPAIRRRNPAAAAPPRRDRTSGRAP